MKRIVLILALALPLSGCETAKKLGEYLSDDNDAIPPSPLVEFEPDVDIERSWSVGIGKGTQKKFVKLVPVATPDGIFAAERKGRVYAVAPDTGASLWRTNTDMTISGGPGVGEEIVVVGGNDGTVIALSVQDGKELWRTRVSSEVLAAPRIRNNIVIVRSGDGKLYALSSGSGSRLWIYDRSVPVLSLRGTSAPALTDDLVLAGFDSGRLVALEMATGRLVWETPVAVPRGRSDLERMVDIDAEPFIVDGIVYVATFQGRVAAIEIAGGNLVWTRDISSFAGLCVDDRNVYVSDEESNVWALDRLTGVSVWKQEALKYRLITAPASAGDLIVVGDLEGYLHWMHARDGEFAHRNRIDKSKIIAPPITFENTVIAYTSSGALAAYTGP